MSLTRVQIRSTSEVLANKLKVNRLIIAAVIFSVDETLEQEADFSVSDYIANPSEGITEEEKKKLVAFASDLVNEKVDIPGLNEAMEGMLFTLVMEAIVDILIQEVLFKKKMEEKIESLAT